MSQDSVFRKRNWQEIAAEAFAEKDPAKLERLAEELQTRWTSETS